MNIVLIGFKSAGKSTVGKPLAEALHWSFVDVDDEIAKIYQKQHNEVLTPREIYVKVGDSTYRVLEREAVLLVSAMENTVIATGGGTVCDSKNTKCLKQKGIFVFLDASRETIRERIIKDPTLSFLNVENDPQAFEQAFAQRRAIYQELADVVIDASHENTQTLVEEIMGVL
ncbi:MAG: shikimate kinase [Pseudomonadota bacterium]|nr:shikimate kinase [Gammaproteobacteria bacterium]MBU1558269.1 shikimate kinase [Gammaproteobacteria bacterium]MBU1926504.1 shikimate kinase [Gammaproteobacteria bacterium]MBU2546687.1 shikimate kinase [Gammaproteobacteria bacterium]